MCQRFILFCLADCSQDQLDGILCPDLMGDDKAIKKIFDRGEIRPALLGGDISDICDPFLIGSGGMEFPIKHIGIAMIEAHLRQTREHPASASD